MTTKEALTMVPSLWKYKSNRNIYFSCRCIYRYLDTCRYSVYTYSCFAPQILLIWKCSQKLLGQLHYRWPSKNFFSPFQMGLGGMLGSHFMPNMPKFRPQTGPLKQKKAQKRMKEWHEDTSIPEKMKALIVAVILAPKTSRLLSEISHFENC